MAHMTTRFCNVNISDIDCLSLQDSVHLDNEQIQILKRREAPPLLSMNYTPMIMIRFLMMEALLTLTSHLHPTE